MTWWEKKLLDEPVIRLINGNGLEKAAELMKVTVTELTFEVERLRYRYDFDYFASERLKIVDKAGQLVNLVQNGPQQKLDSIIQSQVESGLPVRICLLKARQWGGSTKFEGHLFRDSILRTRRSSMIVAHDLESARHLREMSSRYYEHYDFPRPGLKKESDKWWKFKHVDNGRSADSHLRIDTADELSVGHSLTIHNMHLSEVQNWRNARELVKGLFPTVPNSVDTMIFMEGTGSGIGNWWYDFCQMARQPETEWAFVFVPWFEILDYQLSFKTDKEKGFFESRLDDDEKALFESGVTLEQLLWRRREISETYKGDMDAFHQQYPATPDEAFITSGRPVFPAGMVKRKIVEAHEPLSVGNLRWKRSDKGLAVEWEDDTKGWWRLYEKPQTGVWNLYVCGADVAEGIAVIPELGNRGGDFSAARIFRRDKRFMSATFHARCDPDMFADELRKAWYFWGCPLFPEQNAGGGGNLVISRLRDDPMVELITTPKFGKKRDETKEEYGWETTAGKISGTKRIAIDELNEAIREESFTDHDREFWIECSTYVRDERGRTNAQSRKFDDLVMATAITLQGDKLLPAVFRKSEERKVSYARDVDVPVRSRNEGVSRTQVMEDTYAQF